LARIVIGSVTEVHTPVEGANAPLHDPLVIVKPLSVYPALLHVWASDDEPEVTE